MIRFPRFAAAICGAVMLSTLTGCATITTPSPTLESDASRHRERVLALAEWRLDGRIGVKTPDEGFQASLRWEHERAQDRLLLSGPFNQGGVSIILQKNLILVRESGGALKTSRDPEALLREQLGFSVPLASLRYWVVGAASPASPNRSVYDASGLIRKLDQAGWSVEYDDFVPVTDLALPQKLSGRSGDLSLKLVVDDWQIVP